MALGAFDRFMPTGQRKRARRVREMNCRKMRAVHGVTTLARRSHLPEMWVAMTGRAGGFGRRRAGAERRPGRHVAAVAGDLLVKSPIERRLASVREGLHVERGRAMTRFASA